MTTKKTQEESEQPAKVYQLDALTDKFNNLSDQMKSGFGQINTSVNALLVKSESQVTPQQLTDNIAALKKNFEETLDNEVKKVHLEYKPLKDNNKWFIRFICTQAVIMVGQLVFIVWITKGS